MIKMASYVIVNHYLHSVVVKNGDILNFPITETFPLTRSSQAFPSSVCCNSFTFSSAVFIAADPIVQRPPSHPPPPPPPPDSAGASAVGTEIGFPIELSV